MSKRNRQDRKQSKELERRKMQSDLAKGGSRTSVHTQATIRQSSYVGPLPPPDLLREFDDVNPGASERIMANWEGESAHRRALELQEVEHRHAMEKSKVDLARTAINGELRLRARGQVFGFIVAISGIGLTGLALCLKFPDSASIIAAVDIGSIAAVFVTGAWKRSRDSKEAPGKELAPPKKP